jgi:FAD/FMN-containing dehydrogenase
LKVSSWGRLSNYNHNVVHLLNQNPLPLSNGLKGLPFGNGRSYGDVCLNNEGVLWDTKCLDRFVSFDTATGVLTCEAGILLRDIQRVFVPLGWMLAVTPGTQLITLGGAIANDVHGKNHHVMGSFGDHVIGLRLLRTDGTTIDCGPDDQQKWFRATVGGMGLTGVISQASIQMIRVQGPWLEAERVPFKKLDNFFQLSDLSEEGWEHSVSWIDCLNMNGRGVFMRANHVNGHGGPQPGLSNLRVPLVPPISLVNQLTLRPFNQAYYYLQTRKHKRTLVHYESFFHPLDNLHNWNRIYGPRGFYQYQSVVPRSVGNDATASMLQAISRTGTGSFLAVIKTFGNRQPVGMMSFPMPGVTLALDFPNKGAETLALMNSLDEIVRDAGGRIYAAKDARMSRNLFESGYPDLSEFLNYRDPGISSSMSRRLMGN